MTLPDERYRAVRMTRLFLQDLLIPGKIPRVPKVVRQQARSLLRHYPIDFDMWLACQQAPDIFQDPDPKKSPLVGLILQHKKDIEEENNDKAV
jgi:hypothetical protein